MIKYRGAFDDFLLVLIKKIKNKIEQIYKKINLVFFASVLPGLMAL